jgi:hypothetical protein
MADIQLLGGEWSHVVSMASEPPLRTSGSSIPRTAVAIFLLYT